MNRAWDLHGTGEAVADVPADAEEQISFRTAAEIEAERKQGKDLTGRTIPDSVIAEVVAEVADCAAECRSAECRHPEDDPLDPWTAHKIIYDNTIGTDGKVRLQIDMIGQARLTFAQGDGRETHVELADEMLSDIQHLILRGLNRLARDRRRGWAARALP